MGSGRNRYPRLRHMLPMQAKLLRRAIALSVEARRNGDHPFGALIAIDSEVILEARNTVRSDGDPTAHAESNLLDLAIRELTAAELSRTVLYSSCEPCPMCAGKIYWAGVRALVFGLSHLRLSQLASPDFKVPCRELFAKGLEVVQVTGPELEDEAEVAHRGFWSSASGS